MLSICHIDHNSLLTLIINSKFAPLESLHRGKLRAQYLYVEDMLAIIDSVDSVLRE